MIPTKNIVLIIIFVVLAAGIIVGGMWYSAKISERSTQSAAQAGIAAEAMQSKLMESIVKDIVVGTGAEAENGQTVTVNYEGRLDNGTVFDSSYKRHQPFSFPLGAGQVIKGWDLGVLGMRVGGKRELTIPGDLAYGAQGIPQAGIGPNATLHFTVELLSVSSTTAK